MQRPCEDMGGKEHIKSVRVGHRDTQRDEMIENYRRCMNGSLMSRMLTNGTVALELLPCGDIILEGSSHNKTSQDDQDKAHAALERLTRKTGFMENLYDHIQNGDAATFEWPACSNVRSR